VDGKIYIGSRQLKHLRTVLYKNYVITKQLLKTSTTEYLEIRGLLEKYPTFGREKETGLLGALDT